MARQTRSRARNWCFTINNPTESDQPQLSDVVKYVYWQVEAGEEDQTPHIQGYLQLDQQRGFTIVKNISWLSRAHIEQAQKGLAANKKYCSKLIGRLEGPFELGEAITAGQRTDIQTAAHTIIDLKKSFESIMAENPEYGLQFPHGCKMLRTQAQSCKRGVTWRQPQILVYWGRSGCGKSRRARLLDPYLFNVPVHEGGTVWFDGYDGQKTILWDDFYGGVKYSMFLRATDGYAMSVQTKGGFVKLNHKLIIITSNSPPEDWYSYNVQAPAFALLRRLYEYGHVLHWSDEAQDYVQYPYTLPMLIVPESNTFH